jgi:hypothetical protein
MEMAPGWEERESKRPFPLFPPCLGKLAKNASFPHSHSFGDGLGFPLLLQARLTLTSTKSVTYMPATFCYRHARSHRFYISGAANSPAEDILPYLYQRTA